MYSPVSAASAIQSVVTVAAQAADARSRIRKEVKQEWEAEEDPFRCTAVC